MKRKSLPTGRDFLFVEGYGNENPGAFQSPRPLRGATIMDWFGDTFFIISIHAPLAGRDRRLLQRHLAVDISTHAPLTGRDKCDHDGNRTTNRFQPTRPLRGATVATSSQSSFLHDFNPRAPCGARLGLSGILSPSLYFNPRAPCGARPFVSTYGAQQRHFNPRAPCGARL